MRTWTNPQHEQLQSNKPGYLNPDVNVHFINAPMGGWDAISPLSAMDPQYAVILDNVIPRPSWLEPRGGASYWIAGLTSAPINTLMTYRPDTGIESLFAASGDTIYDVSTLNTGTIATTGKTSDKWQYVNFTPAGGSNYLAMVNGSDPYLTWDGATWTDQTINNVSSSTFDFILAYKRRLWFLQNNSTDAWYLGTDAISGDATKFSLGSFMTKGGYLLAVATWTLDGGTGPDDFICFITSKGQAIIYTGEDPNTDFNLKGVFDLPTPIGRRCTYKIGSDIYLISTQGLLPISQALPYNPSGVRSVALTNRIQNAMLLAAQAAPEAFGWQIISFPKESLVILNVPQSENVLIYQYVMNPMNGSWCRFTGWNAQCFEIYNENLYYGDTTGNIVLGYAGTQDLGQQINCDIKCAFNYLESPGRIKNMSMLRPYFTVDTSITIQLGVDVDFADDSPTFPINIIIPPGTTLWDVGLWDVDVWSQVKQIIINWLSVNALGTAMAVRLKIALGATTPDGVQYTSSGQGVSQLQINVFEALEQAGGPI